jgi:hypothetical protein
MGVLLLRTFSVAVTTPASQASRRLSAVDPNVAKALAIVALGQTTFGLISLNLHKYVAEVGGFKYFLGRLVSHQGEKRGRDRGMSA